MITLETRNDDVVAGMYVDEQGAKFLIEVLQQLLDKGTNDHIHLTALADDARDHVDNPDNWPMRLKSVSGREAVTLIEEIVLVFREEAW